MRWLPLLTAVALLGCDASTRQTSAPLDGGMRPPTDGASPLDAPGSDGAVPRDSGAAHDSGTGATADLATTVIVPSPASGSAWEWLNPRPTGEDLQSIWSDGTRAWAVGTDGAVLYSTDGTTWATGVSNTTATLYGVWGSGQTVWAVGANATLLSSVDGGQTFTRVAPPSGVTADLHGVWSSGSTVFVAGDSGTILRGDGGVFTQLAGPSGTILYANLASVWGRSASDVWIAGEWGSCLHATDGIHFVSDGQAGDDVVTLTGTTTDLFTIGQGTYSHFNGTSWTSHQLNPGEAIYQYGIWAPAADDVFVTGDNGTLYHSANDFTDQTTTVIDAAGSKLFSIWGQGTRALVSGSVGVLLATTDHAQTWQALSSGAHDINSSHSALWAVDDLHVYAVDDGAHLWRTSDGGQSWTVVATGATAELSGVVATADGTVLVTGTTSQISSALLRSTDFGDHFATLAQPVISPQSLWLDGNKVYIAGDGLAVSTNFGDSWTNLDNREYGGIGGPIWAQGASIVANGGSSYSTDGGQTFQSSTTPSPSLFSLWGASPTNLWGGGANGALFHSTDGGKSWTSQTLGTDDLFAVSGRAAGDVFAAPASWGPLFHSPDNGATWEQLPPVPPVTALAATNHYLYSVGSFGHIARIAR